MTDQIEALGHALTRLGYSLEDDGAQLIVDAPVGTTAIVHAFDGAYRCTFSLLADVRASVAWADWTAKLARVVAAAWVDVEGLPARAQVEVHERVELVAEPRQLEHLRPLGPRVDPDFEISRDEAERGRFRVVSSWDSRGPGWEVDGPTLHWHAWAADTAWTFGVSRAWASLGATVDRDDRAAGPVKAILLRAAEGEALPSGIVALDLRGLPAGIVHALVGALVARVRSSDGPRRGVIVLADVPAAAWVARTIELDVTRD